MTVAITSQRKGNMGFLNALRQIFAGIGPAVSGGSGKGGVQPGRRAHRFWIGGRNPETLGIA